MLHVWICQIPVINGVRQSAILSRFLNLTILENFTTMVANEGLEKAEPILNQVPRDGQLYIPSEGCGVNYKHFKNTPTADFSCVVIFRVAYTASGLRSKVNVGRCMLYMCLRIAYAVRKIPTQLKSVVFIF